MEGNNKHTISAHKPIILTPIGYFNNYCHWHNPQTDPWLKVSWLHEHKTYELRTHYLSLRSLLMASGHSKMLPVKNSSVSYQQTAGLHKDVLVSELNVLLHLPQTFYISVII